MIGEHMTNRIFKTLSPHSIIFKANSNNRGLSVSLKVFVTGILTLICVLSCSQPNPTVDEWNDAMDILGKWVASDVMYNHFEDSGHYSIDFFESDGQWFAAVISARKDTFGLVNSYIGKYDKDLLYYVHTDLDKILAGEFLHYYDSLLAINACWILVDSVEYWTENRLKELWIENITLVDSNNFTTETYRSLPVRKQ